MGSGHNKIRKIIQRETSYIDKSITKHHHNYNITCVLQVYNNCKNSLFDKTKYYEVLKCSNCNSFIAKGKSGNCQGYIGFLLPLNYQNLPRIVAFINTKYLIYDFSFLENVEFIQN